ncbi:MAG TPA: pilin, partial [Candidatus Paceibacterota bacterium]|nr:pilin [Candidatus Paceibacterota bacterium]
MMTSYNVLQPIGSIITGSMTLGDYLEKMFFLLIGVSGVLAVVMLVICGIKLMMSEGAGGREAAKKCIWDAIFGLLIAIGAWLLLNTINPQLVSSTLTM